MLRHWSFALLLAIALLAPVAASAQAAEDVDEETLSKTRFGVLSVVDDEADSLLHTLLLDGKEILRYEGEALSVDAVYSTKKRDIALVGESSGGIACPVRYVVVQLEAKKAPLLSGEFGSCLEVREARIERDALVLEMPVYVAHPEEWDEKDLTEAERSKVVYTWAGGKLTEKTVKR